MDDSAEQRSRLRRELSRLDTIFFLVSAMVVVDTLGAIAVGGGQAFTWLLLLFLCFFVPSAMASAELGAAIPAEGGAYVWVREAFGQLPGSLTSLLYWAGTPMWLGGSVTVVALAVVGAFFTPLALAGSFAFGALFVGIATLAAVVPLRYGKWMPSSGAISQIALLSFFTLTVILYGVKHGVEGATMTDFRPTYAVFIAIAPILLYSFVGVELPSTAGEEMVDPKKDIPFAIGRAGVAQILMYGIPILAVLLVLPASQVTSLGSLIDAMKTVFTVYGGSVGADGSVTLTGAGAVVGGAAACLFIWALLASGTAWIMGAGRAQAAACLDGGGPAVLGRISERTGVPVVMGLVSGGVSLAAMTIDLAYTQGDNQKYFSAALTVAIALIMLAYLLIFPAFVRLRYKRADLARPFLVPGGRPVAWLVSVVSTAWALFAVVALLWPGFGTADPDSALPAGFVGQRTEFEVLVLLPIGAVVAAAVTYDLLQRRRSSVPAVSQGP